MRTLNIFISDLEFRKFGLKKDNLSFSELLDVLSNELTKRALNESVKQAGKYNLSDMTMNEVTNEVKATRRDAKIDLMKQASGDLLFLADIQEVADDFNLVDHENI